MKLEDWKEGAAVIFNKEGGCYFLGKRVKDKYNLNHTHEIYGWKSSANGEWRITTTTVAWGSGHNPYLRLHPDPDALCADYCAARLIAGL